VHDDVWPDPKEGSVNGIAVAHVERERAPVLRARAMLGRDDVEPAGKRLRTELPSEVARPACHENPHRFV
jgi:hypothetical protein